MRTGLRRSHAPGSGLPNWRPGAGKGRSGAQAGQGGKSTEKGNEKKTHGIVCNDDQFADFGRETHVRVLNGLEESVNTLSALLPFFDTAIKRHDIGRQR